MPPAASSRTKRASRTLSGYLPLTYLALVAAVVVLALPTALRPPQTPPNSSAELSPDAPPDRSEDAIVSTLNRGSSGAAGAGSGDGPATGISGDSSLLPSAAPTMPLPPRFCPNGFGIPPRQVESYYSAPCAGAWFGDNGGATYKGVTANEVRIASLAPSGHNGSDPRYIGPVPDSVQPDENDAERTWRVYQQYFNQNFQFWGRHLRFFVDHTGGQDQPSQRAAVQRADEEWRVFALTNNSTPGLEEAARRRLVGEGGWQLSARLYRAHDPYLVSWWMDGTKLMRLAAEYLCKKLAGKPAQFAGPGSRGEHRKFGLIVEANWWGNNGGFEFPALVKEGCGEAVQIETFGPEASEGYAGVATSISKFRLNGVTTIAVAADAIFQASVAAAADSQSYFPEWFVSGYWLTDQNIAGHLYSPSQWAHAFGISPMPMAYTSDWKNADWYRAYKSIDPAGEPYGDAWHIFGHLLQLANGIQMAGPQLTPETFRAGLARMGKRASEPGWTLGGGWVTGDPSYADNVAEIWWDATATDPESGVAGAYRYARCGQRFGLGQIPVEDPQVFNGQGCASAPALA